jgi:hypothetical protein
VIVKLVNKTKKKAAENHAIVMGQNPVLRDKKSSFYEILPFAIVCTRKQNSCSLPKQDSFSMDENIENGWLHIAAKMNFGVSKELKYITHNRACIALFVPFLLRINKCSCTIHSWTQSYPPPLPTVTVYIYTCMYMYQMKNSPKLCACRSSVSCCEGILPFSFVANNYHGWIPGIFWGRILQIKCIFERGKNDSKQFVSVASITL